VAFYFYLEPSKSSLFKELSNITGALVSCFVVGA
jgi:hypothetical protein